MDGRFPPLQITNGPAAVAHGKEVEEACMSGDGGRTSEQTAIGHCAPFSPAARGQ